MDRELIKKHEKTLLTAMTSVDQCQRVLSRLDRQWTRATLTGKINCSRIAQTLIDFIIATQENFTSLQTTLIDTLVVESTQKVVLEIAAVAQVAIDILKRNLFERTADVGFLATDDDIVRFLLDGGDEPEAREAIEERLAEYRAKYTVYDEILVLDTDGCVRAHLDRDNPVTRSHDPLIARTLAADQYVETYGESDLAPGRGNVLLYSQAIRDPGTGSPLGVLCLRFDFDGEMAGIFEKLGQSSEDVIILILDESGKAIATSDPVQAPAGRAYPMALTDDFHLVQIAGQPCLAKTLATNGYQGFFGLPWYGHVLKPVTTAFGNGSNGHCLDERAIRKNAIFSGRLVQVEEASENVLSDLELVVQNGEIMAAKKSLQADPSERVEAHALPHVLNEVKKIGDQVQHVFQASTDGLLRLVTSSRLHDVRFLAQLAIDIMDRNLYERANDCRWWALTSDFRRILDAPAVTVADNDRMREILAYINSLYTVYTNLFLYDRAGKVLACSNPDEHRLEGRVLDAGFVAQALRLTDSQSYAVSDFEPTDLYAENGHPRPTYVYNAAVTSLARPGEVIGGIGIVFDSAPQFLSMLSDCLPRDGQGRIQEGSEGLFVEPGGRIIASTNPDHSPGDVIDLAAIFCQLSHGQFTSHLVTEGDRLYAVGCAHCSGYREYKRDGAYANDLLAVIKVRI
ncbi:cache domain-containing protein [Desulfolutivibrio sulfoxidireducens]|uniref:cache domain-containing protein n=1 Tax=Desulfolutivibrio sulfoxidireducens TaxID=2773299 RepID=UPI00159EA65E|nr:cache domain-containing protein [Desulfolutivibrio sulfoxidireducens]QLA17269.1 chemotaxis protein CheW [Desulfolutivibrio sulfoxidireducens]QLA20836.1 chemotaxis protein CheW [Desulfolutivibrio sulfoxidireducens]